MSELTIDRPIQGDVTKGSTARTPQKDAAAFLEAIDRVLDQDGVLSIHWTQYIPYFNDGDACEFGSGEVYVRLNDRFIPAGDALEDDEDWEDEYIEDRPGIYSAYSLYHYGDLAGPQPKTRIVKATGEPTDSYDWATTGLNPAYSEWSTKHYSAANKVYEINGQDTTAIAKAFEALNMSEFEDVIRTNFGDHAQVSVNDGGFKVEYYEHD